MEKRRPLADTDRHIGIRLQYLRRRNDLTQAELGQRVGLTRAQITNFESCRTALPLRAGWEICKELDIHPVWLLTEVPSYLCPFPTREPLLDRVERLIAGNPTSPFSTFENFSWLLGSDGAAMWEAEKKNLISVNRNETVASMTMQTLLDRVRKATSEYGAKAALARDLGVSVANVSQWLSGSREPSGKTTLALLSWVEQWERKQKNR